MLHHVGHGDAVEIEYLAAGEYRRDYLMLLGRGKDENGMSRRLLQCFQKRVESLRGKHVHLVDYEHTVAPLCRRHHHLLRERAHVVHAVVARRIEFYYVERPVLVELPARIAFIACLAVGRAVCAVYSLGKNARARCFAHTARPAEQVGMRKAVGGDGVFQRGRERLLPHHARKRRRTVFPGRYNIVIHSNAKVTIISEPAN